MREIIRAAVPDMFEIGGEDGYYTRQGQAAIPCKLFIDYDVQLEPSSADSQVFETGTVIEVMVDEVGDVARGDVFTYNGTDYTVLAPISNDKITSKWKVS